MREPRISAALRSDFTDMEVCYRRLIDTAHTQQLEFRINYTALFGEDQDAGMQR